MYYATNSAQCAMKVFAQNTLIAHAAPGQFCSLSGPQVYFFQQDLDAVQAEPGEKPQKSTWGAWSGTSPILPGTAAGYFVSGRKLNNKHKRTYEHRIIFSKLKAELMLHPEGHSLPHSLS